MRAHNIFPLRGKENKLLGPHLQLYCPSRNRLESFWKSVTPFESKKNPKKRAFERERDFRVYYQHYRTGSATQVGKMSPSITY